MRALGAAILIGLKDMRGDLRRFGLLVVCLAVGTALIAGVSSVGTSIRGAVDENAALIMGGDIELSRTDRAATLDELEMLVQKMEKGDMSLDESLAAYERGVNLYRQCQGALEQAEGREPPFFFMKPGDTVRIEMKDAAGHSIFGAIAQTVVKHG